MNRVMSAFVAIVWRCRRRRTGVVAPIPGVVRPLEAGTRSVFAHAEAGPIRRRSVCFVAFWCSHLIRAVGIVVQPGRLNAFNPPVQCKWEIHNSKSEY